MWLVDVRQWVQMQIVVWLLVGGGCGAGEWRPTTATEDGAHDFHPHDSNHLGIVFAPWFALRTKNKFQESNLSNSMAVSIPIGFGSTVLANNLYHRHRNDNS